MNKLYRSKIAHETVAICDAGCYTTPGGERISISKPLESAEKGTVLYSLQNLKAIESPTTRSVPTQLEARNETVFQAIERLASRGGHIACLNFASAKNPGGGFLNGAVAQEEALACASGMYRCLLKAPEHYHRNRANNSAIYLDLAIYSPLVPFFRDDAGTLLNEPILASVITAAAPNAGAVARNEPANLHQVEPALRRRAEMVLQIASMNKVERLILGAWGCGVFRNEPAKVAAIFWDLLGPSGRFSQAFAEVAFAVYDRSENLATYRAFAKRFNSETKNNVH